MRLQREQKTLSVMIGMYCSAYHKSAAGNLCDECAALEAYALARIEKCRWGTENKPVCADCSIHCYKPEMRERIRQVMRYAGPRMLLAHPWLAIMHLVDKRRHK